MPGVLGHEWVPLPGGFGSRWAWVLGGMQGGLEHFQAPGPGEPGLWALQKVRAVVGRFKCPGARKSGGDACGNRIWSPLAHPSRLVSGHLGRWHGAAAFVVGRNRVPPPLGSSVCASACAISCPWIWAGARGGRLHMGYRQMHLLPLLGVSGEPSL